MTVLAPLLIKEGFSRTVYVTHTKKREIQMREGAKGKK